MSPLIIAHRGLLNGPNKQLENTFEQLDECIRFKHLSVEVDIWVKDGVFWAGHDNPTIPFEKELGLLFYSVKMSPVFVHAKNLEALNRIIEKYGKTKTSSNLYDFFMHDKDEAVLTNDGFIWTYPGKELYKNSIAVLPEICDKDYQEEVEQLFLQNKIAGVCTDYPLKWKEKLKNGVKK